MTWTRLLAGLACLMGFIAACPSLARDTGVQKTRAGDRPMGELHFAPDPRIARALKEHTPVERPEGFTIQLVDPLADPPQPYYAFIIGNDPTGGNAQPYTVTAAIVPVVVKFGNNTLDPSTASACANTGGVSPLNNVLNSPIFNNVSISSMQNGTNTGTSQLLDLFQRSNFWQFAQPGGISPNYHTLLSPLVDPPFITYNQPPQNLKTLPNCGNGGTGGNNLQYASVKYGSFDAYIRKVGIHTLSQKFDYSPTAVVPIFLLYNVTFSGATLDAIGYHNVWLYTPCKKCNPQEWAYIVASWFDPNVPSSYGDVKPLEHEIAEWMNDPLANNPTPPWHFTDTNCSSLLEVGDSLAQVRMLFPFNGYTYTLQDLTFEDWFFHDPSIGVNGWYSMFGAQTAYAPPCP